MDHERPRPHRRTIRLESGLRLSYWEHGEAGGEPLVLLHGYTDSSFSFSRLMPLRDPGRYHAYALDQRGHGDSERPISGYSVDDFALMSPASSTR